MNDIKRFDNKTREEILQAIVEYGDPSNLKEAQNSSPTTQEMLDLADKYNITFEGYIVLKPREDWRVSLEGFTIYGVSAEGGLTLLEEYDADEKSHEKHEDGTFDLRFWWD